MRVCGFYGAVTTVIKAWARIGDATSWSSAPYDPESHTRKIPGIVEPSNAQIRDLNLPTKDLPGAIGDYKGSEHFQKILAILGREHRRDALHVDSAGIHHNGFRYSQAQGAGLLGIRFLDPRVELGDFELLITCDSS